MGKYIIGITGASGTIYAERLVLKLLKLGQEVHLCMTDAAYVVARSERNWDINDSPSASHLKAFLTRKFGHEQQLFCYDNQTIWASLASGSFYTDGMVVLPCSMGTLSAISHGTSDNLLERAADVCLKERRPLLLVPREAPYNQIHLENMLHLAKCGAVILPASPGFYSNPQSIEELVDFFLLRVMDQLGLRLASHARWDGIELAKEKKFNN